MVTELEELVSVYFWWGVIFEALMNVVINMQSYIFQSHIHLLGVSDVATGEEFLLCA